MEYINSSFRFSVSDSWTAFSENNRQVFQSNDGKELILSVNTITENGKISSNNEIRNELISASLKAIEIAVNDPALKIVNNLQKEFVKGEIEMWKLSCEVIDEEYIFEQAVLATDSAVLLVTFESPKTVEALKFYKEFILSIDKNKQ